MMWKTRFISCSTFLLALAVLAGPAFAGVTGRLELLTSDECVSADEAGDTLTVTLNYPSGTGSLISFQAFVEFDDTKLSFVSGVYGSEWAGAQTIPIVADGTSIAMSAVHAFTGPTGAAPIVMAVLTFDVIATTDCDGTPVVFSDGPIATEVFSTAGPVSLTSLTDTPPIVIDTTPPVLTCPDDVSVECGGGTDPADTGTATATDDCEAPFTGAITYSDVTTPGASCATDGILRTITRTWSTSDACGNTATCVQTIEVIDTTPPSIDTPAMNDSFECGPGADAAFESWLLSNGGAAASDDCDPFVSWATIPADPALSDGCGGTGSATVTFVAFDDCGNTSTTAATFSVVDTTLPTFTFVPLDTTVECSDPTDPANTGGFATATDTCGSVVISFSDMTTAGACGGEINIERTWRAADECGNIATDTQTITVLDKTAPEITTFVDDLSLECFGDLPGDQSGEIVAVDACSGVTVTLHSQSDNGGAGCAGSPLVITRTYRATDDCGNFVEQDQTITIVDTTPPVLDPGPADMTVEGCEPLPPAPTLSATDNCSGELGNITATEVEDLAGCGGTGTVTRTWTATDSCGNTSLHIQVITVIDTTRPVFTTFPANAGYECLDEDPGPDTGLLAASDNCSDPIDIDFAHIQDSMSGTGCPGDPIVITRVYGATDECGNEATRVQTITVADETPPVIDCSPTAVTIDCDDDTTPDNPELGTATATDNCDADPALDFSDVITGDPCDPMDPLTITRTWTATDDCGNSSTCVQVITLEDEAPPTIDFCPPSMTVFADAGLTTATVDPGLATATDDCDPAPVITATRSDMLPLSDPYTGSVDIIWTATDCWDNSSTCTQSITVLNQNEIVATVQLRNVRPGPFTRCIDFQVADCDGTTFSLAAEIEFTDGIGTASLAVDPGVYDCVTARDSLHTLRRNADASDGNFGIDGLNYAADFTLAAGNDLIPGNLDADDDV
ncbi:MAG: HYR-like domain-containing protein, partial [Planctomycetota bacterium]